MVSFHTFNIWSKLGEKIGKALGEDTILAHVPCHEYSEFCQGLNSAEDFHTVVAYKNGQNIGKTENIGDVEFYQKWIELTLAGPLQKVDKSEIAEIKKGFLLGKRRSAVTIGIFPSDQDTNFQHFQIAAEKLAGKYYIAYSIVEKATPTLSTYKWSEKQKRSDYSGKFDPATLMEFLTKSALPNVIDITNGFTTSLLLRQKRPILIQISSENSKPFLKLAARGDARKSWIFTKITRKSENLSASMKKALQELGVEEKENVILIVNKDRIHKIDLNTPKCPDHLQKLLQMIGQGEANKVLSTKSPHPLRYLQVEKINNMFGFEESIVLPDHTLFLDSDPFAKHAPISGDSGGCPFMQGGGASGGAGHTEL